MSIPPIQARPIISQLASLDNQSSPRARRAQGEIIKLEVQVEQKDSFESLKVRMIFAHDSAHLRRVAAQKQHASISAPPTPIGTPTTVDGVVSQATPPQTLPDVVGDRLAPDPTLDPAMNRILPTTPMATPSTPAPVTPPVLVDRLAPDPTIDPAMNRIVPSTPLATPSTPAPVTPPVLGDRLAPDPTLDPTTKRIMPSNESEHDSSDSIDSDRGHGRGHGQGSGHESIDTDHHGRGNGHGHGHGIESGHGHGGRTSESASDEQPPAQTFTKVDLDRLLGAFGRTSEQKGFTPGLDLNADGMINAADLADLLSRFDGSRPAQQTPAQQLRGLLDAFGTQVKSKGPNAVYDSNSDGMIDATDLADLLNRMSLQPSEKASIDSILDAFNTTADQADFNEALDLNGDGRIDAADLAERLARESS